MENKIWAYFVSLINAVPGNFELSDGGRCSKTRPANFCYDAWKKVSDGLAQSNACNTILIEVEDALKYESHPEISLEDAWTKEALYNEVERLRSLGFNVYPVCNFSAAHDDWMGIYSRMVSTPQYYSFCKDIIEEISEVFSKPELFHLGMDEECQSIQQDSHLCIIRNEDLYWNDIKYLTSLVEKNGSRPWMWADYVWHTPVREKSFLKNMSHEVLLSNWYYGDWTHTTDFFYDSMRGYEVLESNGYEQVPTGSTCSGIVEHCRDNLTLTVDRCTDIIGKERLKGFMMAPWEHTNEENLPKLMDSIEVMKEAQALYNKKMAK